MIPDLFLYLRNQKGEEDDQCPGCPVFYKNRELDKVQIKCLRKLEDLTGINLFPTYNYARVYNSKSILKSHTDRPACEISVTMNIGYDGNYNWPIWITDKFGQDKIVILEPGDGLIYLGCEQIHWRADADERIICQSQLFCHYVNQNGPYEDCIYDKVKLQ